MGEPYALDAVSGDDPSTVVAPSTAQKGPADLQAGALALTIVWHPDLRRVGEVAPLGTAGTFEVSRRTPPFEAATDVFLSRAPFLQIRARADGAEVSRPTSSTAVEIDGRPLIEPLQLSADDLRRGAILTLGGSVVVCLHRRRVPALRGPPLGIVGGGDAIEAVRRQVSKVADLDVSVLIRGETGTGKELVARAIAAAGKLSSASFVAINMAAIPNTTATDELFGHEKGAFTGAAESRPGYFVEADGGVLFLDEIGAASSEVQAMLLRVLETGEIRPLGARRPRAVNVRVVAATDEDLDSAVHDGRFSEPLLHRLAGYQIRLPALRERREDIGTMLVHFLRLELATVGETGRLDSRDPSERPWLRAADVARIAVAPFPGNVRQLRNIARQLVISNRGQEFAELDATIEGVLGAGEGAAGADTDSPRGARSTKVTDDEIRDALRRHNFNFSAAAEDLGIHRSTLYDRVRQNPQDVRSASDLSDAEILGAHERHAGDVAAMAAELRVSPKPLKARLTEALGRRTIV
jgi:two-component system nitrogen regulation response regulator GlnG